MKGIFLLAVVCMAMRAQTFSGTCSVTTTRGKVKQAKFSIHQNQIEPILTFRVPVAPSRPDLTKDAFYQYTLQINYLGGTSFQLSDVTPNGFDEESRVLVTSGGGSFNPYRFTFPTPLDKFNATKQETYQSLSGKTDDFQVQCSGKFN